MIELNSFNNIDCMQGLKDMVTCGQTVDMLLTDLPYGEVNGLRNTQRENYKDPLRNIHKGVADIMTFPLGEYLELVDKVVTQNFIIFCGRGQFSEIYTFFDLKGYTTRAIVWEKKNPSPMNGEHCYLSGVELAVYAKKKGGTFNAFCKNTVLKHNSGEKDIHPTQKTLSLWYELIKDLTKEGDTILDTCAGSGTTMVACRRMNRKFIMFELDKEYFDLANERMKKEFAQVNMFDIMNGGN